MTSGVALDVRLAVRALRGSPIVTAAIIGTFALAIGASTAIASLVDHLLVRSLPVRQPDRLALVSSDFAIDHGFTAGAGWSAEMWQRFRDRSDAFAGALAWHTGAVTITRDGVSAPAEASFVSGSFFTTLGVAAREGRVLSIADEATSDGSSVAVLGDRGWRRLFASAPNVVGSIIDVNGTQVRIVGIMPATFNGLEVGRDFDLALTLASEQSVRAADASLAQSMFMLLVMVRLRDGQPIDAGTRTLRQLQPEIVPARAPEFASSPFALVPAAGGAANPGAAQRVYRQPLVMTLAGVALVLLIACANVANLLLARATARRRDAAIRAALGASRWRLARTSLVEALLMASCGASVGILLALWAARAIVALTPVALDIDFDWRVGFAAIAITTVAAIVSGLGPALKAMQSDPAEALKDGGRGTSSAIGRLPFALAVVQLALAIVLLVAAGLLVRSFVRLGSRPLGFTSSGVVVATVDSARATSDETSRRLLEQQLVSVAQAVPGIAGAGGSTWTPLGDAGFVRTIEVPAGGSNTLKVDALVNFVTPGWLATYQIPLKAGRDVGSQDLAATTKVAVVNEAFARRMPIGQPVVGSMVRDWTIVGVAGDAVSRSAQRIPGMASLAVREPVPPTIYLPLAQAGTWEHPPSTLVRISVRPAVNVEESGVVTSVRAALLGSTPNLSVTFHRLDDDVHAALGQERLLAVLSASFAAIALTLAAFGLYALIAYGVARRIPELGVRVALGASRASIIALVCRQAVWLVSAGMVIGLTTAAFVTRPLSAVLYDLTNLDVVTYGAVAIALSAIALTAALVPAIAAARMRPSNALTAGSWRVMNPNEK